MKQATALGILKAGRNVYLTGAAGSGKTYVLTEYIRYLKERGVVVGVTATTGIAATHVGGITVHSWSGIGIRDSLSEYEIESLLQKERLWKRFDKTKVLIIDEISMMSPTTFNTIEAVCRAMKGNDKLFGGMQVVLSGDFFQLPPVTRGISDIHFVSESYVWADMDIRVCYLDEQFRHEDRTLEGILNEIRRGDISPESKKKLLEEGKKTPRNTVTPTRLFTHNKEVDALNEVELDTLPGEAHVFEMKTKGRKNLVESLRKGVLAPEMLRLKKGAAVMFVKNNFEEGYVNGTLGVVEDIEDDVPVVRTFSGHRIYVQLARWTIEEDERVLAQVEQIPLRLAWAITVHKSQGMSLDAAEIDLSKSFVPGQGYVALSRLRNLDGLLLRGVNQMSFAVHPTVFELDRRLLSESAKWEAVVGRFSEDEMRQMQKDFIVRSGGTTDEREIEKNRAQEKKPVQEKVPTHIITKGLIEEGLSLQDIAERRGLVVQTILGHLEKLRDSGEEVDLARFQPHDSDFKKIEAAFVRSGDTKLTPVYRALREAYSYDELRLARLFLRT